MTAADELPARAARTAAGVGRFARDSVLGATAGVSTALGSLLGSIIVAHSLGVAATGKIAFALWVVVIAAALAGGGIPPTLTRYLPALVSAGKAEQAARLAGRLHRLAVTSSALVLGGFATYAWCEWQAGGGAANASIWLLVGLACAQQTLAGFTYGRLRGSQRFDRLALVTGISVACQLAAIAAGSMLFGLPGALAGYCIGSLLPAALSSRGHACGALAADVRAQATRYALYAWAAELSSMIVWSRAEVFFLQRSAGNTAVGLFSIGLTLANVAAQGPALLTGALLPRFAQSFGAGAESRLRNGYAAATRLLAFLVFPACFGMAAVLPSLLPMVYGQDFAPAVPAAAIMVLAAAPGAVSSVGSSLIMAMDRSDFTFVSGLIAAALTILAGFTVIPAFGLMGAAWTRAGIQAAAVAFGSWFVLCRLRVPMPFKELGKLLLAAVLCGAAARFCLAAPGMVSLPAAIAAGVVVYAAAVRVLRALPPGDIDLLRAVGRSVPGGIPGLASALRLLAGPARPQPADEAAAAPAEPFAKVGRNGNAG